MNEVTTICYGKKTVWKNREEAISFFREAMFMCDGSEAERYTRIFAELIAGKCICSDME